MSKKSLTSRSAFTYMMLLLMVLSTFPVFTLPVEASDNVPYGDIGTEWTKNSNLLLSDGAWDARVWQWSSNSLELQHNDVNNYVKWNSDGQVELQAHDGLGGSYQASNFDQGYEKYENQIFDLNDWGDWDNKACSIKVEGAVTLFDGAGYTGNNLTFTADVPDLSAYAWDYKVSSMKLSQGSRVTIYSSTGYEGNNRTFVFPSYQPPELTVADKGSITLEGVVSNWHTDTSTFPGWTGAKFDVFAVEDRYNETGNTLMLEMYFLRDGANLAWSSYNLLQGCAGNEMEGYRGPPFQSAYNYLVALDAFPEFANMTTYPENRAKWTIDVKTLIQRACDHDWGESPSTYQLDINKLKIVKVSFTVESARFAGYARAACTLNRLRLAYTEEAVYSEHAFDKPQDGTSWAKVNDSSVLSGFAMKAAVASPNGGVLFGPYITTGASGRSLAGKPYYVVFKLKVSSNLLNDYVVHLDVCHNAGEVITSNLLRSSDFAAPNEWQSFELAFVAPSSIIHGLEFRVNNQNNGLTDLFIDEVHIYGEENSFVLHSESAFSKPQSGSSWVPVSDYSSFYGQVMKASESMQNYACLYGPYIKRAAGIELNGEPLIVTFKLKVSSNSAFEPVARIDVAFNAGIVIRSEQIKANDFPSPNEWQEFQLEIIAPDVLGQGLEFRVYNINDGVTDLFFEGVSLAKDGAVVHNQSARDKPSSGDSWMVWNDPTSLSGTAMKASQTVPNGGVLYGPYIKTDGFGADMHGGTYSVRFRMKVSTTTVVGRVAYLDVCYDLGMVIRQMIVLASEFNSSNVWQEFEMIFHVPEIMVHGLEFRIMNLNRESADLYVDNVSVSKI